MLGRGRLPASQRPGDSFSRVPTRLVTSSRQAIPAGAGDSEELETRLAPRLSTLDVLLSGANYGGDRWFESTAALAEWRRTPGYPGDEAQSLSAPRGGHSC